MNIGLLHGCKYTMMLSYTAAGTSDITPAVVIDTAGYEGVQFIASIGAVTATGRAIIYPEHSAASASTSMVAMTSYGSGTTSGTTAMGTKCIVLDLYRPTKRYVSAYIDRHTANVVVNSLIAICYGAKKQPVSQSTAANGVIDSDQYASPTT